MMKTQRRLFILIGTLEVRICAEREQSGPSEQQVTQLYTCTVIYSKIDNLQKLIKTIPLPFWQII